MWYVLCLTSLDLRDAEYVALYCLDRTGIKEILELHQQLRPHT